MNIKLLKTKNMEDCYSFVWENPEKFFVAVRKALRFERDAQISNIPIEISSEVLSLETQKMRYLNECHDAHIVLRALMRTARNYRSVIVLNKGEACVRWTNSKRADLPTIDLVVDLSDVAEKLAQQRVDWFGRRVLCLNLLVFGMVAFMFVQVVWYSQNAFSGLYLNPM
jgi:hypothetical protein